MRHESKAVMLQAQYRAQVGSVRKRKRAGIFEDCARTGTGYSQVIKGLVLIPGKSEQDWKRFYKQSAAICPGWAGAAECALCLITLIPGCGGHAEVDRVDPHDNSLPEVTF